MTKLVMLHKAALVFGDGSPKSGFAQKLPVRRIQDTDFARIVDLGLLEDPEDTAPRCYGPAQAAAEETGVDFSCLTSERLTRWSYRNRAFLRKERTVDECRRAFSGLRLGKAIILNRRSYGGV